MSHVPAAATPSAAAAEPQAIDDAFYALIASDPDLLRAEFDELIGNAWGPPPEPPTDDRPPQEHDRFPRFVPGRFPRARYPDGVPVAQERSPPRDRSS